MKTVLQLILAEQDWIKKSCDSMNKIYANSGQKISKYGDVVNREGPSTLAANG